MAAVNKSTLSAEEYSAKYGGSRKDINFLRRLCRMRSNEASVSAKSDGRATPFAETMLGERIFLNIAGDLLKNQGRLGKDFESVLADNLWELYAR